MTSLLQSEISKFINIARKSPNFDVKKTMEFIDANDKDGLFNLLLKWVRDTFPHYFVVPESYQHHIPVIKDDWMPIIMEEINKVDYVQPVEDMIASDKTPCGCHIDDEVSWHPPQLPPSESSSQCKSKTCGCNCVTNCPKCLSYPCIKCGIPLYCSQPCVCSDCKVVITNDLITTESVVKDSVVKDSVEKKD